MCNLTKFNAAAYSSSLISAGPGEVPEVRPPRGQGRERPRPTCIVDPSSIVRWHLIGSPRRSGSGAPSACFPSPRVCYVRERPGRRVTISGSHGESETEPRRAAAGHREETETRKQRTHRLDSTTTRSGGSADHQFIF